jgi:prepilin-type N-terminal cleavage/methylation domain-containing protein/prepilin-type processing-associated H-X9-DG protein
MLAVKGGGMELIHNRSGQGRGAFTRVELPALSGRKAAGFTLVELLVVIGIIAILMAILLPSLNKARAYSKKVNCMSNLRQIGAELMLYSNNSKGWLVPVGGWEADGRTGRYMSLGTNVAPPFRWPAMAFKLPAPPVIADPIAYQQQYIDDGMPSDEVKYPVIPYTPKVMVCPADDEPAEHHSFIINKHLAKDPQDVKKFNAKMGYGRTVSDVPLVGEKRSTSRDYYMEKENYEDPTGVTEFEKVVELYRHGTTYGSNYLFMDLHVASILPNKAAAAMDPWDVPKPDDPVQPTSPTP